MSRSRLCMTGRMVAVLGVALAVCGRNAYGQGAEISGVVSDSTGAVISQAALTAENDDTGTVRKATTTTTGLYSFTALAPGAYTLTINAPSFRQLTREGVRITVGQVVRMDFTLEVAGVQETATAQAPLLSDRAADGTVGAAIENRFVQRIPLSGRTFHALLELAPGVMNVPTTAGAFAVNGQRTDANYFTVDGVSANVGVSGTTTLQYQSVGQTPAAGISGGFNGLASLDALEEFRIQTSTFAPEYGRSPGAQVSFVTKAGTNSIHGSAFEQFRSDAFDAKNWFVNAAGLPKNKLQQNAFGGSLGGPIVRNHLFYFAALEGLRLQQPRAITSDVPSLASRAQAQGLARDLLDAFPLPTGADLTGGMAAYAAAVTDTTHSANPSVRVDWALTPGVTLFGRYNDARATATNEWVMFNSQTERTLQSTTGGATIVLGPRMVADAKVNYTSNRASLTNTSTIGEQSVFPSWIDYSAATTTIIVGDSALGLFKGRTSDNRQSQLNVVGTLSAVFTDHQLKTGIDYRTLSPDGRFSLYDLTVIYNDPASVISNSNFALINNGRRAHATVANLSAFAQDTWRLSRRASVTYGVRWDRNPPPDFPGGTGPLRAENVTNLSQLHFDASQGQPLWEAGAGVVAPRLGVSYTLDESGATTLTGGVGLFFGSNQPAASVYFDGRVFPNNVQANVANAALPFQQNALAGIQPSLTPPYTGIIDVVDTNLKTPETRQWNVELERRLGSRNAVTVGYVGSSGIHLLSNTTNPAPNPQFPGTVVAHIADGRSRYQSFQLQWRGRDFKGLDTQVAYTWSTSRDSVSNGTLVLAPIGGVSIDTWAPSDFDIRHYFTGAVAYEIPGAGTGMTRALLSGWSLDGLVRAHSAPPVDVLVGTDVYKIGSTKVARPDLVAGQPLYVNDPNAPGGWRFNKAAFQTPPNTRQGTLGRNALRGFGGCQVDLGLRRSIPLTRGSRLQLRLDAFNLLNTALFSSPQGSLRSAQFGLATSTANMLVSSGPGDQLNPLYQWGGPRSIEMGVKLQF